MATVKLKVEKRDDLGKQGAKRVRASGMVPAVLYGEKEATLALAVDSHELRVALSTPSGSNVIVQMDIESGEARAVIREMARDPVTRRILHVDFQRISENKPIHMRVPVVVVGESVAVKEGRGILDHAMRELEVRCLPRNIPESIKVDVSALEVKHAIHVADITVPDIEILDKPERPVVEILQPTIYREPEEELEEGAEVAAEGEGEAAGEEAPEAGADQSAEETKSEK